ncbi:hypothetical protein HDU76_013736 [Blyttiomyces sp. JEL0837]|nr:hypothetical protein HDU76_013736 [Blyttiomyces sp. JEL0837]
MDSTTASSITTSVVTSAISSSTPRQNPSHDDGAPLQTYFFIIFAGFFSLILVGVCAWVYSISRKNYQIELQRQAEIQRALSLANRSGASIAVYSNNNPIFVPANNQAGGYPSYRVVNQNPFSDEHIAVDFNGGNQNQNQNAGGKHIGNTTPTRRGAATAPSPRSATGQRDNEEANPFLADEERYHA